MYYSCENHPLSCVHNNSIYFHNYGNIDCYFHDYGNIKSSRLYYLILCYNIYLYSESNKSVIFTSNAIASVSSWNSVGDTFPFSMLLIVDFPIPDFLDNSINVNPFWVLISHNKILTLLTSLDGSLQSVKFKSHKMLY